MRKVWGEPYRTSMICVDHYHQGILSGRFYHPYLTTGQKFHSLMELLLMIESVLEEMQFPQSFTGPLEGVIPEQMSLWTEADAKTKPGKLATFTVRILFRQNASWQGTLSWVDHQMENRFRSVLELIFLMNSALSTDNGAPVNLRMARGSIVQKQ